MPPLALVFSILGPTTSDPQGLLAAGWQAAGLLPGECFPTVKAGAADLSRPSPLNTISLAPVLFHIDLKASSQTNAKKRSNVCVVARPVVCLLVCLFPSVLVALFVCLSARLFV